MSSIRDHHLGLLATIGASPVCRAQAAILGCHLSRRFPDVAKAIVGQPEHIRGLDREGWTLIESRDPDLCRGFESKLHLWKYTPFERTVYLDVDLVPLAGVAGLGVAFEELLVCDSPVRYYAHRISTAEDGMMYQGADVSSLAARGIGHMWYSHGGGHYVWDRGGASRDVFELAAKIAEEGWPEITRWANDSGAGNVTPDEVVVGIALRLLHPEKELLDIPVVTSGSLHKEGKSGSRTAFVHFFGNQLPLYYDAMNRQAGVPWHLRWAFLKAVAGQLPSRVLKRIRRRAKMPTSRS